MGSFSIWHWAIVLVVVMLVFGTSKLRNIGKDLGGAIKDFKKGMGEGAAEADNKPVNLESASTSTTTHSATAAVGSREI